MGTTLAPIRSALLGISLLVFPESVQNAFANPPSIGKPKHELVPDFCQVDPRFGMLADNGRIQCGPVAASNLLMYLNNAGFPGLLSEKNPGPQEQVRLINLLSKYMKTSKEFRGTSPYNLMQGLKQYTEDKDYKVDIQYIGYEVDDIDKNQKLGGGGYITPTIIKDLVDQGFECIVRIGYYDKKVRIGGHYATVVGFNNECEMLVHDSSRGSGLRPKTEIWKLHRRRNDWEVQNVANAGRNDKVCLDGVIAFKLLKHNH